MGMGNSGVEARSRGKRLVKGKGKGKGKGLFRTW